MIPKYILQTAVDSVCEFLEISQVVADSNDTLDSLTLKVNSEIKDSSSFAQKILTLSEDYDPLKLNNILNAVMLKNGCEQSPEQVVDDNLLRTLYHVGIKKLDKVLSIISRDYCMNSCYLDELRCCIGLTTHKSRFSDCDVLNLQEKEAVWTSGKHKHPYMGCQYLSKTGCTINITKPPICIGFQCGPLESYVRKIAPSNADDFISSMDDVCKASDEWISPEKILALDQAALLGKLVIEERDSKNQLYNINISTLPL